MTYKISFDHIGYLNLSIDLEELMFTVGDSLGGMKAFKTYSWDNKALSEIWEDVGGTFVKVNGLKHTERPDITTWNGANLVLSQKAHSALSKDLAPHGEFLPITLDGAPYIIFNCLNAISADKSVSEADIQNDLWMGVKSIGFTEEDVDQNLIFKTKFDRCVTLYCGDRFKSLVEDANLKGINFLEDLVAAF
ncbi:hypothetical protein MO867_19425 [Microbulbifer sp. OS29]|uniref:Uncharacterized protein n=1 Tax=Microbulbifer okhotskensis TaxID=2926617 RepID=A0A9X2J6C8_9GAMM|nr:hypothetical protein [Microbulbifer okhotskensis]MCO1336507.1 hypothetical protein [Microbulbifer okhotskensis]